MISSRRKFLVVCLFAAMLSISATPAQAHSVSCEVDANLPRKAIEPLANFDGIKGLGSFFCELANTVGSPVIPYKLTVCLQVRTFKLLVFERWEIVGDCGAEEAQLADPNALAQPGGVAEATFNHCPLEPLPYRTFSHLVAVDHHNERHVEEVVSATNVIGCPPIPD